METANDLFVAKYKNFQEFIKTIRWINVKQPHAKNIDNLSVRVFQSVLTPYATTKYIEKLNAKITLLNNPDFDKEDAYAIIQHAIIEIPVLSEFVDIDADEMKPSEAEKFCRYIKLFLQLLL